MLSILIGFLALIGLAEFIPGAQLKDASAYPEWLAFLPLETLETITRILIIALGLVGLGAIVLYGLALIHDLLLHHHKLFSARVQELWNLVDLAKAYAVWGNLGPALQLQDRRKVMNLLRYTDAIETIKRRPEIQKCTPEEVWKN